MTKVLAVAKRLVKAHAIASLVMNELFDRIDRVRQKRGWSMRELSRRAGLAPSHVGHIKNGTDPKLTTILRIASALGVTVQWLATGDGHEETLSLKEREILRLAAEAIEHADSRRKSTIRAISKRK